MATPQEMAQAMVNNLEEKTGKPLVAWKKVLAKESFEKHGQIVGFLKKEHGVTHGFASLIAHEVRASSAEHAASGDDLVVSQYSKKQDLLPIYEQILGAVSKFGKDVEVSPKKAYVSLRRKKQFALVKPATKTRMDIGIHLPGEAAAERLVECKSASMTSHQVSVESGAGVDEELILWLKKAYERAG